MKRIPSTFLKDIYERNNKYITVYDHYTPNYNRTDITRKFYSKHECEVTGDYSEIINNIGLVKDRGPKEKQEWPETTSQWYGWFLDPLVEVNKNDYRLYFPRVYTEVSKNAARVKQNARK